LSLVKEPAKPALSKGQVKVLARRVTVYIKMYQIRDTRASKFSVLALDPHDNSDCTQISSVAAAGGSTGWSDEQAV
jgi:hypothetical protein